MVAKVFLDSNILVYAFDSSCPKKQKKALACIQTGFAQESAVLSPQVLSEFFVVVTRKIKAPLSPSEAMDVIETVQPLVTVDIDYTLVIRAIQAQTEFQLSYWDGLIIAAAERAQCSLMLSEDLNAGQCYWGITVENPLQ